MRPTRHYQMLRRTLPDTAAPRDQRMVVLVGSRKALGMADRRTDTGNRHSALRQRLREVDP